MFLRFILLILVLVIAVSCSDDDPARPVPTAPLLYAPLTERDHTLFNMELAYRERNLTEYQRVLDPDNFIFFFGPHDIGNGDTPEKWGYDVEIAATRNMFDRNFQGGDLDPITKIDLDLAYTPGDWVEESPPPPFDNETWYTMDFRYTMFIKTSGPIDFLSTDIRAQVTVREVDEGGTQVWKIVIWRDALPERVAQATTPTEYTSWGKIKTTYSGVK